MTKPDDLTLAHILADEADRIAGAAFVAGRAVDHEIKADGSPVTAADIAVERVLLAILREQRADDAVIGEEVGSHGNLASRRYWTLDGIDGTAGFAAGSPMWSTLIGLVVDGVPRLGVSTSVGQARRWWALTGSGTWSRALDEHGGATAPRQLRATDVVHSESPRAWVEPRPVAELPPGIVRLMRRVRHVEMTTHPAKMVASGELDLAFMHAAGIWDVVPLLPLVAEAGGLCFGPDGQTLRSWTGPDGQALQRWTGDVSFAGGDTAAVLPALLAP